MAVLKSKEEINSLEVEIIASELSVLEKLFANSSLAC